MNVFAVILILLLTVIIDYFWIDMNSKRWGWLKNRTKQTKVILLGLFIISSLIIYIGISLDML